MVPFSATNRSDGGKALSSQIGDGTLAIHSKLERQLARGHVSDGTLKRVKPSAELEAARP